MMKLSDSAVQDAAFKALDAFKIEIPSWGFANTGTRFGKFVQAAAATSIEEKFADAGEVNKLTGVTPTVALHVLWDLPNGVKDVPEVKQLEKRFGVKSGSINPNLFQDQEYKYGSLCNPSAEIRQKALDHMLDSIAIGKRLESRDVSLWMADGSNYPGTQSMRKRIGWLEEALHTINGCWWNTNRSSQRSTTPILPTGACQAIWRASRARRRGCWWIPAITTTRRISSRLWRGCCTPTCWAGSTSTIAAMPTTI
jgi:L-rhamnose isomerase/sugar isomerase